MRRDAELLRAEDPAAFRELYDRHAANVYGFHRRRCRDDHVAHDLTAETFAHAWISRKRFRDEAGGRAGPWLVGIARNVLAASVRRGRLEQRACERLGILAALDRPAQPAPDESWLGGVDEALEDLPAGQRDALELRVLHDLEFKEVARRLDTTPAAARVRVTRALATLRDQMTKKEEGTS